MATIDLEPDIREVGRSIAAAMPSKASRPIAALDDKAMDLTASDQQLKAALFRFVDVVPACRGVDDLARHLAGFLDEVDHRTPPIAAALKAADTRAGRFAIGTAAAAGVKHMAHRFIVGEDPRAALAQLERLWRRGVATSVDLLGEATVTSAEADRYAVRCGDALTTLAAASKTDPDRGANLSVKVSALTPLLRPDAPRLGIEDAKPRLRALLRQAKALGAHLHVDTESFDSREAVVDLVGDLLGEDEFRDGPSAGVVLQAYLRDAPDTLDHVLDRIAPLERTTPLTVRLVKGAYWDHEVVEARQHGWEVPVFEVKADSDRCFEALTRRLLDERPAVKPAIASHNLRSVAHAVAADRAAGGGPLEFQVLRGLGDPLQDALAALDLPVRTYCPVGDLVSGMAYLVRRLLENTSNDSFLADQAAGVDVDDLLAAP